MLYGLGPGRGLSPATGWVGRFEAARRPRWRENVDDPDHDRTRDARRLPHSGGAPVPAAGWDRGSGLVAGGRRKLGRGPPCRPAPPSARNPPPPTGARPPPRARPPRP